MSYRTFNDIRIQRFIFLIVATLVTVAGLAQSQETESPPVDPLVRALNEAIARAGRAEEARLERDISRLEADIDRRAGGFDSYFEAQPGYRSDLPPEGEYDLSATAGIRHGLPGEGEIDVEVSPTLRHVDEDDESETLEDHSATSGFAHELSSSATMRFPLWAHSSTTLRLNRLRDDAKRGRLAAEYDRDLGELIEEFVDSWFAIVRDEIELQRSELELELQKQRVEAIEELVDIGERNQEELWDEQNDLAQSELAYIDALHEFRENSAQFAVEFNTEYAEGYVDFLGDEHGDATEALEGLPGVPRSELLLLQFDRRQSEYRYLERALEAAPELFVSLEADGPAADDPAEFPNAVSDGVGTLEDWSYTISAGISFSYRNMRETLAERRSIRDKRDRVTQSQLRRREEQIETSGQILDRQVREYEALIAEYTRRLQTREDVVEARRTERRQGTASEFEVWDAELARNEVHATLLSVVSRKRRNAILYELRYRQ